jgi:Bacterial surface proteins containing Ig-like domains
MKHRTKKTQIYLSVLTSVIMMFSSLMMNVQTVKADTTASTAVSTITDYIGKEIILNFDRPMKDLSEIKNQLVAASGASTSAGMINFEPAATEIDTSDPSNTILKYKYNNLVDYDNVNLVWYFTNGFFRNFENNLANYVKFYEKDTGKVVPLPNVVTVGIQSDGKLPVVDGYGYMEITDWYFRQIQNHAPLGLHLVSQDLKPSTTYVIEIEKGFLFNNELATTKTYSFEFTTTAVTPTIVNVTGVYLNQSSKTLTVGDGFQLAAAVTPDNATNKGVTWSSSNDTVATVDQTGKVTAVGEGTEIITVTTADGSKTAQCTVTVKMAGKFTDNQTVDANKIWTIRFTDDVGYDDLTKQGIIVTDIKGNIVNIGLELGQDSKTLLVTAPEGGYTVGENYILYVNNKAHSKAGKALKNEYKLHFNIK